MTMLEVFGIIILQAAGKEGRAGLASGEVR